MTASNTSLIPVPVTDKNGVTSTKWKLPETINTSKKVPAPVPAISGWEALRKDFRGVSKLLLNTTARLIKAKYRRENMIALLHPDTLNILNSHFGDDLADVSAFIEDCIRDECLIPLNSAAVLIDCARNPAFEDPDSTGNLFYGCIRGLSQYEEEDCIDYSDLSDEEREVGKALMLSAALLDERYVSKRGWGSRADRYLIDEELISLIRRRPDDYLLITSMLMDRGMQVKTPEQIATLEELLAEGEQSPLLSGVL